LAVAIEEARARGAKLRAVYAFATMPSPFVAKSHEYLPQLQEEAKNELNEILARAPSMDGMEVEGSVIPGLPAEVLIDASKAADLLVVGSRGRGGFEGLILVSVSTKVTQHAHCSVLVAR
jgi:nucleotide-binding universal stress UspA family protein